VSYRHSSYRKHKKAMRAARQAPDGGTARHHGNRISHWLNARPMDKSGEWGVRRHRCCWCGKRMAWIDCPTGGWWAHDVHPSDHHDAARRR
jgi:hypothetical protein